VLKSTKQRLCTNWSRPSRACGAGRTLVSNYWFELFQASQTYFFIFFLFFFFFWQGSTLTITTAAADTARGTIEQHFEIPDDSLPDEISARFEDEGLRVTIPRVPRPSHQRIRIAINE